MNKSNYVLTPDLKNNNRIYFGVVIDNYIANVLTYKGIDLFYYKKNTSEIDFVIQVNNKVVPIEVKSGNNTKAKSLKYYVEKYNPDKVYKFSRKNIDCTGIFSYYPVYAIEFIDFEK